MANALGIDLGEVYRTVEAVKTSRAARGANEAATAKTNAISQAAAVADPSKPETMAPLIALDPKMANDITTAYTAMDEAARTAAKTQTEQLGQLAYSVQSAPDPAAAYATILEALKPEERAGMPETYDPNWVTLQLARAREIDSIYDAIDAEADDARTQTNALALDDHQLQNDITLEGVKSDNAIRKSVADAEAEGAGGVDTAGSNAVARVVAGFFGGTYGPDGTFGGMDKETAAKSLEVAAKAETLMKETPGLAINEAVQKAAEELGYQISGVNRASNNALANGNVPGATGPTSDPFELGL
jgi:hypothetical protein